MVTKRVKSSKPIICIGLTWLIYAFFLPMYRITDFIIAAASSAIVYFLTDKFVFKGKEIQVVKADFGKSGDKAVDDVINDGERFIEFLQNAKNSIHNDIMKKKTETIIHLGSQIYQALAKKPENIKLLRNFSEYYIPQTKKLIESYIELTGVSLTDSKINDTVGNIESAADSVISVFRKQLDNLYSDQAFDIRTDIKVLEALLAEQGIQKE